MARPTRPSRSPSNASRGGSSGRSSSSRSTSRRGAGSRGGASRGGYGAPAKSSNAMPALVAGALVLLAIVGVIALTMGRKEPEKAAPPPVTLQPAPRPEKANPSGPSQLPPPEIPRQDLQRFEALADEIVREARPLADQGDAAYKAALEAKEAGNNDLWQDKLGEATNYFGQINDLWNELIVELDGKYTNRDWDAEQVANRYFGTQADAIRRYLQRYQDIRKQRVR